jgi:hypothetical protein
MLITGLSLTHPSFIKRQRSVACVVASNHEAVEVVVVAQPSLRRASRVDHPTEPHHCKFTVPDSASQASYNGGANETAETKG